MLKYFGTRWKQIPSHRLDFNKYHSGGLVIFSFRRTVYHKSKTLKNVEISSTSCICASFRQICSAHIYSLLRCQGWVSKRVRSTYLVAYRQVWTLLTTPVVTSRNNFCVFSQPLICRIRNSLVTISFFTFPPKYKEILTEKWLEDLAKSIGMVPKSIVLLQAPS